MKKRITRQRIAAILATAMLFWLPAGAMNEATPTDLTGGIKTSTVKIGGMTVILTTVEAQDKGARLPEVTGITNEKIIRAVE